MLKKELKRALAAVSSVRGVAQVVDRLEAWATTPGWSVQHAGIVRFEREGSGTRVEVQMAYNPVVGALGHVVASLFGTDPLTELDEDLLA